MRRELRSTDGRRKRRWRRLGRDAGGAARGAARRLLRAGRPLAAGRAGHLACTAGLGIDVALTDAVPAPVLAAGARRRGTAQARLPRIAAVARGPDERRWCRRRCRLRRSGCGSWSSSADLRAYHIPWRVRLRGALEQPALRRALNRWWRGTRRYGRRSAGGRRATPSDRARAASTFTLQEQILARSRRHRSATRC